jgi:phosphatidylglycerol---prolipoprotein diacylglyceryl transferase
MDFPVYLEFGTVKVLLHNIFEPLAFFIGFRFFLYLKKKKGDIIEQGNRTWIIIGAIFGALIGSRLVGGFENLEQLRNSDNILLHFYSNKTVLGGLLGGLFGVELTKKIVKEKNASGDLFVYPLILALIIGRIGCFSMGLKEETYGLPTSFFAGIDLGDGKERHPVTLYEIIFLVFLWLSFKVLTKRFLLFNGSLFKLFMIAYICFRFTIEYIKPGYVYSIGFSAIQIACLIGVLWYLPYIINHRKLLN